mgnify:CR=1 FL=1|tara:strand:- start:6881 stop:7168 length:288 start_codon:yes stop_codon:yes gene_type:complete
MYKKGDTVLIKSIAGDCIPSVHAVLIKKIESQDGWIGWECKLINEKEIKMLRKEWSIPYKYPKDVDTFTYEDDIIKKVTRQRKTKSRPKPVKKTI